MIFHVVMSVYRLVKIWNSPQFPDEFWNGQLRIQAQATFGFLLCSIPGSLILCDLKLVLARQTSQKVAYRPWNNLKCCCPNHERFALRTSRFALQPLSYPACQLVRNWATQSNSFPGSVISPGTRLQHNCLQINIKPFPIQRKSHEMKLTTRFMDVVTGWTRTE